MDLIKEFKNPTAKYRGAPFWSWNDSLEKKELLWQVRDMKKAGLGGFFMHPRVGLITPYLSKEWFNIVKDVVKEAKRIGMLAYLYDEDRWPSGFAGGLIPAKGISFRQKFLLCTIDKNKKITSKIKLAENAPWYNGYSYIDTMKPKVTDAFIESTYEPYKKAVGNEFGKTVPAIFTDEPNIFSGTSGYSYVDDFKQKVNILLSWTDSFPQYFKEKKGYDILKHLNAFFSNNEKSKKIKYDYFDVLTDLFRESYGKRIYEWCKKNKIMFTGHYDCEDTLKSQTRNLGSAMPLYEYMQMPGIDHLGKNIDVHLTVKQASSVAHQFGRKQVLSELYGGGSWDLSFADQKWIGDWEYALGVNFRCQHLTLYSMRGCRKRDFPPSNSYQQPWWKHYRKVEDYFGRLGCMLTKGKFWADILLIHPVGSAWLLYDFVNKNNTKLDKLDKQFDQLSRKLSGLHWSYDYGDEKIIEKHAKVEKRKFRVKQMSYSTIVIPPAVTLKKKTFELLKEFLKRQGKIIVCKPYPTYIEGKKSSSLAAFMRQKEIIKTSLGNIEKTLNEVLKREISVSDNDGKEIGSIYHYHSLLKDKKIYFFTNTNRKKSFSAIIKLKGKAGIENWDPETGKIHTLCGYYRDGYTCFNLKFAPVQSYLIVMNKKNKFKNIRATKKIQNSNINFSPKWEVESMDLNSLTLDYCAYKVGEDEWSEIMPTWKAQMLIRKYYSLDDLRFNKGVQFWKTYNEIKNTDSKTQLKLKFNFYNTTSKKIFLVVETPQKFAIRVNDRNIKYKNIGWWIDKSFKKINITSFAKKGKNEIELSAKLSNDLELENIYIIGDFAVANEGNQEFKLTEKPKMMKNGNWVNHGYPFYAGTMAYKQDVFLPTIKGKAYLKFQGLKATVAKVIVNGKDCGLIAWQPYKIDITKAVKRGKNHFRIELTNSLQNLLGPHHHKDGLISFVSPRYFCSEEFWTDKYFLTPQGIFGKTAVEIH